MFSALFFILVGLFLGWTIPQPEVTKPITDFITSKIASIYNKL